MQKQPKKYIKLRGKKRGLIGINTLWLGPDHLLHIDSKRLSEDYRRFYYKDIQAIITRKTVQGKINNLLLLFFIALFTLVAFWIEKGATFFWIIAGLFLLALLINLFLGPTCICHIQTAVQTEKLPSLCRLRSAQKAVSLLKPLIEEYQGALTTKILKENVLENSLEKPALSKINGAFQPYKHEHGTFHRFLFFLLLAGGLFYAVEFFYHHVALTLLGSAIILGTTACLIIALVKQHESDIKNGLKAVVWTSLGYICVCFLSGYIIFLITAVKTPEIIHNHWELTKRLSALGPWDGPWFMGLYIFSICASFTLGISGLILLKKHVDESKPSTINPAFSPDVPLPVRSR